MEEKEMQASLAAMAEAFSGLQREFARGIEEALPASFGARAEGIGRFDECNAVSMLGSPAQYVSAKVRLEGADELEITLRIADAAIFWYRPNSLGLRADSRTAEAMRAAASLSESLSSGSAEGGLSMALARARAAIDAYRRLRDDEQSERERLIAEFASGLSEGTELYNDKLAALDFWYIPSRIRICKVCGKNVKFVEIGKDGKVIWPRRPKAMPKPKFYDMYSKWEKASPKAGE